MIEEEKLSCTYKNYIYRGKNWKYSICNADDGHCEHYYYTICKRIYYKNRAYRIRLSQQCKCLKFNGSNSRERKDTY